MGTAIIATIQMKILRHRSLFMVTLLIGGSTKVRVYDVNQPEIILNKGQYRS